MRPMQGDGRQPGFHYPTTFPTPASPGGAAFTGKLEAGAEVVHLTGAALRPPEAGDFSTTADRLGGATPTASGAHHRLG
jgi:hypothetical protein